MQIKITNEQPFQVLSTNFTIGSSASGYTLHFSADGVEYSPLFSVAPNTERMVTDVANGAFYKLVGNTDELIINYQRECHSGSGGGEGGSINDAGSETNPIYTKNGKAIACPTSTEGKRWGTVPRVRETDGVMEVGKYLDFHSTSDGTTDFDGRLQVENKTLYYREHGGTQKRVLLEGDAAGSNYAIVDELPSDLVSYALSEGEEDNSPATPNVEGQMAWLKTEYGEVECTILQLTDNINWEHIGTFKRTDDDMEIFPIGAEWNADGEPTFMQVFAENFEADGEWHIRSFGVDGEMFIFHYMQVQGLPILNYFWENENVKVEWQERMLPRLSISEGSVTQKVREGAQYIYSDEYGWKRNIYDLNAMTEVERLALISEIVSFHSADKTFPYPITFKHYAKSYRATTIYADPNFLRVLSIDGDGKTVVTAEVYEDGILNTDEFLLVDEAPQSYFFKDGMGQDEDWEGKDMLMNAYSEIKNNRDGEIYNGKASFYMLEEGERVTLTTIRLIEGWEDGTEDWVQMFGFAYHDGTPYIVSVSIHVPIPDFTNLTFEHSRNYLIG